MILIFRRESLRLEPVAIDDESGGHLTVVRPAVVGIVVIVAVQDEAQIDAVAADTQRT